jgi:hypothetical protein
MAVTINIPSQVKTYANLAAFPASGSLKTIFIAEDTNKTYRWTGSVYVEISGADFSGYVPTSRTLTINGTTQDLSANRTFTIPTDLTVGTTPIASGTIGRVLFQGTGNVLQQSSSLFFDSVKESLGLGTSDVATPLGANRGLVINGGTADVHLRLQNNNSGTTANDGALLGYSFGEIYLYNLEVGPLIFGTSNTQRMRIQGNGNVLINTTTDAGFRLDVNGTARVQGNATVALNQNAPTRISITNTTSGNAAGSELLLTSNSSALFALGKVSSSYTLYKIIAAGDGYALNTTNGDIAILNDFATGRIKFATGGVSTAQMTLFSTGNFAINTTTDAGFRLDVNGTARVSGILTAGSTINQGFTSSTTNVLLSTHTNSAITNTGIYAPGGASFGVCVIGNRMANAVLDWQMWGGIIVQAIGVNASLNSSAMLQADSTTKGFLPPRMTTTQKNAIASPAAGLVVYDTTLNQISYYNGTTWTNI